MPTFGRSSTQPILPDRTSNDWMLVGVYAPGSNSTERDCIWLRPHQSSGYGEMWNCAQLFRNNHCQCFDKHLRIPDLGLGHVSRLGKYHRNDLMFSNKFLNCILEDRGLTKII